MTKTKKQHYVPQFYLRRFASEDRLYAFDKASRRAFPTNVRDIASDRFFYEIPELNRLMGTDQALEKYFQPFEDAAAVVIQRLVETEAAVGANVIGRDQKIDLALFLALQYLRTKETREFLVQANLLLHKELFVKYLEHEEPELAKYRDGIHLSMPEEKEIGLHAVMLLDENLRDVVAAMFLGHYWVLLRNRTNLPLFTSDHPVVNHGTLSATNYSNRGISAVGAEVVFPLSSNTLLLLLERSAFPAASELDGTLREITSPENVIYYNSHQVRYSYRQVYCEKSTFDVVESMIDESPELGMPKYQRVQVG